MVRTKDGSPMLWESLLTTGVALPGGTDGKDGSTMLWENLLIDSPTKLYNKYSKEFKKSNQCYVTMTNFASRGYIVMVLLTNCQLQVPQDP